MRKKRALITGITGQDGSYLTEFLLDKGYEVFGIVRRSSSNPFTRLADLERHKRFKMFYGNMRDSGALRRILEASRPDEIYNLAAQSDVGISFKVPEETFEVNYHGLGRLIHEALEVNPNVRIYQASTSEMFGKVKPPQNEKSKFQPVSPYGKSKMHAHLDYVVGYRERHGLYISSGILFNHESPRRGEHFVTRKITRSLTRISLGLQDSFTLGNLNAKRDWGYAGDYVEAMWRMLQQKKPKDYVIATGETHTVREFVAAAARALNMTLTFKGKGLKECAQDENGKVILRVDKKFYRPREVHHLRGDSRRAHRELGWRPRVTFDELVKLMVESDLKLAEKERREELHFS